MPVLNVEILDSDLLTICSDHLIVPADWTILRACEDYESRHPNHRVIYADWADMPKPSKPTYSLWKHIWVRAFVLLGLPIFFVHVFGVAIVIVSKAFVAGPKCLDT